MHVLCDGGGAMIFFKALIRNYGLQCGWKLDGSNHPENTDPAYQEGQLEDSYKKYFNKYIPKPVGLSKAYHLPFKIDENPILKVTPRRTALYLYLSHGLMPR